MNNKSYEKKQYRWLFPISLLMAFLLLCSTCSAALCFSDVAYGKASDNSKQYFTNAAPDKKTVSVLNSSMQRWLKNYRSGTTKKYYKKGEASRPAYTTLKWTAKGKFKKNFTVKISVSNNMSDAVKYTVKKNKLKLTNLHTGTSYYWQVTGQRRGKTISSRIYSFKTAKTPRPLRAGKVSNLRDMGGYKTRSGERVVQGKIFRSGNLDSISKKGKKTMLKKFKIRTDLDLRRSGEGLSGKGSPLGKTVNYIPISGVMYEELWQVSKRKGSYASSELNRQALVTEMKVFADENNYPVVFHCIYGRDRTGTLAFTLGALLGMKKTDLYRDYEMTFFSKISSKTKINLKKRLKRFNKLYKYMKTYSDSERSLQYNTERFLIDNGMTEKEIQTIRSIMLQ